MDAPGSGNTSGVPWMATQLDRIEQKIDKLSLVIQGNGRPSRGLVVKVDRLETRAKRVDRIQGAVVLSVMIGFVGATWAVIRGRW